MLASTAKGNVRSCAVAPTCQLWLGNAVSRPGVSLQTSPVPANKRHAEASSSILIGRTPLLEWSQNIDGTNRTTRQLEASMPLNTVMPIDLA